MPAIPQSTYFCLFDGARAAADVRAGEAHRAVGRQRDHGGRTGRGLPCEDAEREHCENRDERTHRKMIVARNCEAELSREEGRPRRAALPPSSISRPGSIPPRCSLANSSACMSSTLSSAKSRSVRVIVSRSAADLPRLPPKSLFQRFPSTRRTLVASARPGEPRFSSAPDGDGRLERSPRSLAARFRVPVRRPRACS